MNGLFYCHISTYDHHPHLNSFPLVLLLVFQTFLFSLDSSGRLSQPLQVMLVLLPLTLQLLPLFCQMLLHQKNEQCCVEY